MIVTSSWIAECANVTEWVYREDEAASSSLVTYTEV